MCQSHRPERAETQQETRLNDIAALLASVRDQANLLEEVVRAVAQDVRIVSTLRRLPRHRFVRLAATTDQVGRGRPEIGLGVAGGGGGSPNRLSVACLAPARCGAAVLARGI